MQKRTRSTKKSLDSDLSLHPFTGPCGRPVDSGCRPLLARLTPRQEAVLRLTLGIGTDHLLPAEAVAALLRVRRGDVRRIEASALARVASVNGGLRPARAD